MFHEPFGNSSSKISLPLLSCVVLQLIRPKDNIRVDYEEYKCLILNIKMTISTANFLLSIFLIIPDFLTHYSNFPYILSFFHFFY